MDRVPEAVVKMTINDEPACSLKQKKQRINWANLPPNVIKIIIGHALDGAMQTNDHRSNHFATSVCDYGLVHPLWKEAILFSRNIFRQKKTLPLNWPHEKSVDIYFDAYP